jgi:pantetheine-phosphate adenylyltransferase
MKPRAVVAIYPGSFDPVTNGHVDIIQRSLEVFDTVIPAILINSDKNALFTPDERLEMLRKAVPGSEGRVQPIFFEGLLVDAARQYGATVIVRGIRAVSDYEYELQMALMNRKLAPGIETIFMVPAQRYSFLSSRLVKEVYARGSSLKDMVPEVVDTLLAKKLNR